MALSLRMATGKKNFTATRIQNASGALLDAGTLGVVPTDANDIPISAIGGGDDGGPITTCEAKTVVTTGVISGFSVFDTEQTHPPIWYRVIIRDAKTRPIFTLTSVRTIDDVFNFDTYSPASGTSTPESGIDLTGTLTGVTFADTDGSGNHFAITDASGVESFGLVTTDVGPLVTGVTFIDTVDSSHWNLVVTGGVEDFGPATSDIGTPVSTLTFADGSVLSVASGVLHHT
jgi:hypothetical protein